MLTAMAMGMAVETKQGLRNHRSPELVEGRLKVCATL
jgi:hypothetical protein